MNDRFAARRFIVSGKVQGVFFRASTAEKATELVVNGTVRNLPDGNVEVLAQGSRQQLQALATWLETGPRHARVTRVESDVAETDPGLQGFTVLR